MIRGFSAALLLVAEWLAVAPLRSQIYPLDPSEFQVNEYTTGDQKPFGVARSPDGSFVVGWSSSDSAGPLGGRAINLRRFGPDGTPRAGDFQVNTVTSSVWYNGSLVADREGNFIVVWESNGSLGSDIGSYSIQARRFRADGTPMDPQEFQVNSYTSGDQEHPRAAFDFDGNFVVVWTSWGSPGNDNSWQSIQARRFRADGTPLDPVEFQVNAFTTLEQSYPEIARGPGGDFVVAWYSYYSPASAAIDNVLARRFLADGTALDPSEIQVQTYTTGFQGNPSVAVSPNGDFVVAWDSTGSASGGPGWSVQMRRFAQSGTPRDPTEIQVNDGTSGAFPLGQVVNDLEGGFVVAWAGYGSPGNDPNLSIQARRYRADGTAVEAQAMQVNTYTTGFQDFPLIGAGADGDFVVAWQSYGSSGTDQDITSIQARRFGRPTIEVTAPTGGGGCTLGDAITAAQTEVQVGECPPGNEGAVIELPPGSTILISASDNGANGLPLIEKSVTIRGRGARIERDPGLACPVGAEFRLFEVADGGILTLEDVSVSNGCLTTGAGGGVLSSGGTVILKQASIEGNEVGTGGGGVAVVDGNLLAFDSTVRGNLAGGSGGGVSISGDPGWLLLERTTISGNAAAGGGGLWLSGAVPALVRNSTLSGNEATVGGGGIELAGTAPSLTLDFSTIAGNGSPSGAGVFVESGVLSLHGTLVGESLGGEDCASGAASVGASGANLDTDGSCAALAGGGVMTVASLGLGSLEDNGGWSRTHLPFSGSPALDAAPACTTSSGAVLYLDQRSYSRPTDDDGDFDPECDLGAVERGPIFLDGFESSDTRRWTFGLT